MMACAITGLPLCEGCSDPVEAEELAVVGDEPFHGECVPEGARVLQEA